MKKTVEIPKHNNGKGKRTFIIHFNDSPGGRIAWQVWTHLDEEQRKDSGLLNIKPGDIGFVRPGMGLSMISEDGKVFCLTSQPLTISLWHRLRLWVEGFFKRSVINVTNVS